MSDSSRSSSGSSASSSDDGIFTEHVDFKKVSHRTTPTHVASASLISNTAAESSLARTDTHSPTGRTEHTHRIDPTTGAKLASSSAPSLHTADDASPLNTAELNTTTGNTAALSVAALQAMSGYAIPPIQRSASTNTEASSTNNERPNKNHRKLRRRRLVGGARPPLHTSTLNASSSAAGGAAAGTARGNATATDGDDLASFFPPANTPSPTSEMDAHDTSDPTRKRSNLHSFSTGDLATVSSPISASNEVPAVSTLNANAFSLRTHHRHPAHAVGSPSALGNSPHSSGLAVPVTPHLLSDEAYLDAFKIPALIAQLSLSLMAAKPVDLRAFTRDWLADRLVSEEDEDDNTAGQVNEPAEIDFVNSSAAVAGTVLSPEQGSTGSYGIGASSTTSDAVSNHSSNRRGNPLRSNATSVLISTRGGGADGTSAAGGKKCKSYSRTNSAPNGMHAGEHENDDDDGTPFDWKANLEESLPELFATTSEQRTLMGALAKHGTETERKHLLRGGMSTDEGAKERRRKWSEDKGANSCSSDTGHRTSAKHKPVRRSTRSTRSPENNLSCNSSSSKAKSPLRGPAPFKGGQGPSANNSSPYNSSPNASIIKTMSPAETSTIANEDKNVRARVLADIAEAAFLHEASEGKENAERVAKPEKRRNSGGRSSSEVNAEAGTAATTTAATSSSSPPSSSSSSDSFFDPTNRRSVDWAHVGMSSPGTTKAPSFTASNKDDGDSHERSESSFPHPIPTTDTEEPSKADATTANTSSLTGANHNSNNTRDSPLNNDSEKSTRRNSDACTSPINLQAAPNPSGSATVMASSCAAPPATVGAYAQTTIMSDVTVLSATSPEPEVGATMAALDKDKDKGCNAYTPPPSKLQIPQSTTAEHSVDLSGNAKSKMEHYLGDDNSKKASDHEKSQTHKANGSSSSSSEGDDNASFAMFSPLLAVDRQTHEVIDYRTTATSLSGATSYPGAPPLSVFAGGISRTATPLTEGAPSGYLVNSLSVGNLTNNNGSSTSAANCAGTASASGAIGASGSHLFPQMHAPTMANPSLFPYYAPRANTGTFNLLPTPMLADMVGGGGPTNSSFGRRGVRNSSVGRHSGSLSVAAAALARHSQGNAGGEHALTPSTAFLAPPPFLTPHEPGNFVTSSNWKSAPNLQLAAFSKLGDAGHKGANTISNTSGPTTGTVRGTGIGGATNFINTNNNDNNGAFESLPQTANDSFTASRVPTPQTVEPYLNTLPAEPSSSYSQSSLVQGEIVGVEEGGKKHTNNECSDGGTPASLSKQETAAPDGAADLNSPFPATLKADAARRLRKLIDQLPVSTYAAAIVFLEGLISRTADSNGVDASDSDVLSTTTTVCTPSSHRIEHFALANSTTADPGDVSMGLSGKLLSPVANTGLVGCAWPIPQRTESSPLGGGVNSVDTLRGTELIDLAKKSTTDIAATKTTGSASVEAIVRDALSQSVLRTLPQTHSGAETKSTTSRSASQPPHAALATALPMRAENATLGATGMGASSGVKDHAQVRAVNLSSLRMNETGELNDSRLFANLTSATPSAPTTAAAAAAVVAAGRPKNLLSNNNTSSSSEMNPVSLVGAASVRSAGPLPHLLSHAQNGGCASVVSSFYKRPSGSDLSSLRPNPSIEELVNSSSARLDMPLARRSTAAASSRRNSSSAYEVDNATKCNNISAKGHCNSSGVRPTDLQTMTAAFTAALVSADVRSAPVEGRCATMPPSPVGPRRGNGEVGGEAALSQQSFSQLDGNANSSTVLVSTNAIATTTPAERLMKSPTEYPGETAVAGTVPRVSATTVSHLTHCEEGATKAPGEVDAMDMKDGADKERDSNSSIKDSPGASFEEASGTSSGMPHPAKVQNLPSTNETQTVPSQDSPPVEAGVPEPEQNPEGPVRDLLSPTAENSETKSAVTAHVEEGGSSPESCTQRGHGEGSITLTADLELPHSKPDEHGAEDNDEVQELTLRQGSHLFTTAVQTILNDRQAVFETTTNLAASVTSTKPIARSDTSRHHHSANSPLSPTRGEVRGDSDSSSNGGPLPVHHISKQGCRSSRTEMSCGNENSGSSLEILGQSSVADTGSPSSHHCSNHWHASPSFLQEGHTFSSPRGSNGGTGFMCSPPPPPLPESMMSGGKDTSNPAVVSDAGLPHERPKHFDDDIDLGATLRTAVVMAAAAGSHNPHRNSSSAAVAGSSFGTFTTQSSGPPPESLASGPFSPHGPVDGYRLDLATSLSSYGAASPHNPGYTSALTASSTLTPPHHEPLSVVSSRTVSQPCTHNNSITADGGNGGPSLNAAATLGADSTSPGAALVAPTTQLSPPLPHNPSHETLVTSSVAAAMNSFLSREGHVSPEEVEIVREAVARFDAFAALDETQLETLVRTMARVELAQGQTLVQEGEPTLDKLLLVVSGKLSIFRKGCVTRSFTRGQFYGEMEMSYHVERSRVTLTAVIPTVVYALTKVDYQKLVIHEKDARRYMFLQYVNQCDLFKGLSPPTKMRLADSFRVCRLCKGAKLTEQGASVQWMYLLMSGTVRMTYKPIASGGVSSATPSFAADFVNNMRKAATADSDIAAAAATTSYSIVELLSSVTNPNDPVTLASISSATQGPNSSLRFVTTASSPPFTPFHNSNALTQTPEGKPGTGVPELLQLAESKAYSAELRKCSGSIGAFPVHSPRTQTLSVPAGFTGNVTQHRLSGSDGGNTREENNSGSANRKPHIPSGDGLKAVVTTETPKNPMSSSQSENRSVASKENSTPQQRPRRRTRHRNHLRQQRQHNHGDPSVLNTPGSHRANARERPPGVLVSLGSTTASLDAATPQRSASLPPSTTSVNNKNSFSSASATDAGGGGNSCSRRTRAVTTITMPKTGFAATAAEGSAKPEDALVVVDRVRGQLVGEPEFVFKCKGLFTAVASTPVQAARISRLHFEAIMNRRVVEELKRSMLLNPDYYYFESTVPEELKQEMRRLLFRLNVGSASKRRSHFALPLQCHHGSNGGGSNEKSASRLGGVPGNNSNLSARTTKHTSHQLSALTSPVPATQLLKHYPSKDSLALPSSPTAKSTSKRRFRTVRVRCDGAGSNADEEMSSLRSANAAKQGGQQQQRHPHHSAPLELSLDPNSAGRDSSNGSPAENAAAAAAVLQTDSTGNSNTNGSSTHYLTMPSVSKHAVHGSSSIMGGMSPNTTGDEGSLRDGHSGETAKGTGGMNLSVLAGRSRIGPRRDTVDNLTFSAKHSSTVGGHSLRISARGEIVFSGSRNLYRFTADAMSLNQSIVIAVVVDGTIIRWNSVAQSVTGYAPFETIGKSIYEFIASEEGRQQMRDVLGLATHYAGKWEEYTEMHLQENRVFPFRQNTGLYQVGLALSVVPSNDTKTAEVLLLVGREGKYRAANTYASDVARWLEGSLKPQLRQFQRRMMQIESHSWRVTSEDALQVKGNLDACLSMVEQFTKFSLLNMEAVNESWRPVRLPALLGRFTIEASSFARQRRHEYYCNIEQVEPKTDIFFDAPQMLAILRLLLTDAFMSPNEDEEGNPIVVHAELRVTVVEPQQTHSSLGSNGVGSPARMTTGSLGSATPTSFAAPGMTNANSNTGAKTNPTSLFSGVSSGLPSHPSNTALAKLADQTSLHTHGAPDTDPLPRPVSFQQAQLRGPTRGQSQPLHSHEEEASRAVAGMHGRLYFGGTAHPATTDDGGSSGVNSPSTTAGDNNLPMGGHTPPSLNAAAARVTTWTIASNPPTSHTATMGCASAMGASSPNTAASATLTSSLRRIRFELRDDGPTIPSLRSPETMATESMRAANSPNLNLGGGNSGAAVGQASPSAVPLPTEGFPNVASSVTVDGNQRNVAGSDTARPPRGSVLVQVEKILSNLGGTVYGFTRPEAIGNVVRVELPLLAVPGASEEGREDENGMTIGGAPFCGGSRTFTVVVADNNRAHQQQMCQILWARQHAVVPVTSFRELVRKLEMNTVDILLIDPLQIDVTSEDYESPLGDDPFDEIRILSARLALVVMTSDFSDWRVQKLLNRHAVVELPKVGSGTLVHIAMQEAEQLVTEMRDEEERIDLIRRTFTNCSAERHKIGKRIGKGTFGDVYEVEDTLTGGKMAMKRMRLHDGLLADEVVQEILAMTTLKHENIIQYFYCEKESDTLLRLYMELAPGGTLRDKIREHPGVSLPFEDIVHHLSDICHGLAYVHEQRYVHGDLKTANLLLGTRGRTKIGDFGTAKHLAPHQLLYTMVGTPQYMAPEVLTADTEERLGYDFKADIWSLGCVVLEMATGNAPFAHLDCAQGMGIIKYLTELTDTPDLSPLFSGNPLVYEFVKSCLDIDPKNRPTAQELLHFDILEGAVASQRAERLVKRAEMLYKLNKYAAMRADGGGGPGLTGDAGGSINSGRSEHNGAGESGLFYSEEDSNTTEDYDYYNEEEDEGDVSEEASDVFNDANNVSASDEEEEDEYTDEEYEFSSTGSGSKGSDTYKHERHVAEAHEKDDVHSHTTQPWQSSQGQVISPVDLVKAQQPMPLEHLVKSPSSTFSDDAKAARETSAAQTAVQEQQQDQQQQHASAPKKVAFSQTEPAQQIEEKKEEAANGKAVDEEEGGEKAQVNEDT